LLLFVATKQKRSSSSNKKHPRERALTVIFLTVFILTFYVRNVRTHLSTLIGAMLSCLDVGILMFCKMQKHFTSHRLPMVDFPRFERGSWRVSRHAFTGSARNPYKITCDAEGFNFDLSRQSEIAFVCVYAITSPA